MFTIYALVMGSGLHYIYEHVDKFSIRGMELNAQELLRSTSCSSFPSRVQMELLVHLPSKFIVSGRHC